MVSLAAASGQLSGTHRRGVEGDISLPLMRALKRMDADGSNLGGRALVITNNGFKPVHLHETRLFAEIHVDGPLKAAERMADKPFHLVVIADRRVLAQMPERDKIGYVRMLMGVGTVPGGFHAVETHTAMAQHTGRVSPLTFESRLWEHYRDSGWTLSDDIKGADWKPKLFWSGNPFEQVVEVETPHHLFVAQKPYNNIGIGPRP